MIRRRHWMTLLPLAALAGCSDTPRAPDLTTEAVYQNDTAGVRFLVPDGWSAYARAVEPREPREPRERPLRLVAYQHTEGSKRADLELYTFAAPEGGDVMKYLEKFPIGPDQWTVKKPTESLTIGGAAAKRHLLAGSRSRADMRRELVEFPRGDRTYLFVVTFEASDSKHQNQARGVIEKAVWK